MPVDGRAVFQLGLIVLAVPAQYFITQHIGSDSSERTQTLSRMMSSAVTMKNKFMSWKYWENFCLDLVQKLKHMNYKTSDNESREKSVGKGESPALEVHKFRDPQGQFGSSTETRTPRPSHVKYRVGQVVRHKQHGYRGVIIGWDLQTKAPESWINQMHPADKPHWRTQPNYCILVDTAVDDEESHVVYTPQVNLEEDADRGPSWRKLPNYSVIVDTRDRENVQKTYVAEENIQVISNTRVFHPEVDDYFDDFDGAQYLARPWLKKVYPHD